MTFSNLRAGQLNYTIDALADRDRSFTIDDATDAGEKGLVSALLAKSVEQGVDTFFLKSWLADGTQDRRDVDRLYARWTHEAGTFQFLLPLDSNGWIWLSSTSVSGFLVEPYAGLETSII